MRGRGHGQARYFAGCPARGKDDVYRKVQNAAPIRNRIDVTEPAECDIFLTAALGGNDMIGRMRTDAAARPGEVGEVAVNMDMDKAVLFDSKPEEQPRQKMMSYWERQFSLRQLLPDFGDWLDWMARESAGVRDRLGLNRVTYGSHARQWIEIGGPPGAVLPVFIHGGYWRALEAEISRFALPWMQAMAGASANVEYRLMPEVPLAAVVDDAEAALRTIASETGARLLVVGHSAGGHLAMMGALRCPEIVAGVVGISGLFDLAPLPHSFLAEEVGLTAPDVEGLSPHMLWQGTAAHVTVAYGAEETPEFQRQSQMFGAIYGARLLEVPGRHHMSVLQDLADPGGVIAREIKRRFQEPGPQS
ncbi:MAG: alpha/beta hydrolase fold domain-containing protein [Rhodobacteraceae bacterium]|nr:alpha/beta hydrolase fold domain-containing protein [Paracoccaceae bacterium]